MDTLSSSERVAPGQAQGASRFRGLSKAYGAIVEWSIIGLFFFVPLFVLPVTIDALEVNKQTLLVLVTFVAALAWLGQMVSKRELTFRRGWLNFFPLMYVVTVGVSAVTSLTGFTSWVGQTSQEYMSFLTAVSLGVLFYLLVNNASESRVQRRIFGALILSATIIAVGMLFHFFNVPIFGYLGGDTRVFNPIGTINAATIFLIAVTLLANGLWLVGKARAGELAFKKTAGALLSVATVVLTLSTIVIASALDYWVLWVILLTGISILFAFALVRAGEFPETGRFILPMALFVVALLLLFLPTPINFRLPVEILPSYSASWDITSQTLTNTSSLFGSGPGTFAIDYAKYHSTDLNTTGFWAVRFDRATSHIFTVIATLGIVGTIIYLAFILSLALRALGRLTREQDHAEWKATFVLFASWFALVVGSFLYSSNLTLTFLLFGLGGVLAAQVMLRVRTVSFNKSPRMGLAFSFLFVVVAVGIVTGLFVTGQRYAAEIAFAQAVRAEAAGESLDTVIQKLDSAATFNRLSDVYYRNLSQALLLKVREELSEGQIPEDKTQLVQALVATSINAAKRATDLSPNNVANWEVRGAIYREVSAVVGGADAFAVMSFETANALEPASPKHLTDLGRSYLVFAENARVLTGSKDQATADAAQATVSDNLKKAEDVLLRSIELKADYAPAHYYLAIVYEREGRLADAIAKMESVKRYNPLDVGVAFQLGLLYLRQGKYDLAEVELARAVELVPTYSNARWFLAAIYEQQGKIEEAIAQVQGVLETNPDNQLVAAKLERLKSGQVESVIPEPVEAGEETAVDVTEGQPEN